MPSATRIWRGIVSPDAFATRPMKPAGSGNAAIRRTPLKRRIASTAMKRTFAAPSSSARTIGLSAVSSPLALTHGRTLSRNAAAAWSSSSMESPIAWVRTSEPSAATTPAASRRPAACCLERSSSLTAMMASEASFSLAITRASRADAALLDESTAIAR